MVEDRILSKERINKQQVNYSINNDVLEPPLEIINNIRVLHKEYKKVTAFEEGILEVFNMDSVIASSKFPGTFEHFTSKIDVLLERQNEILFFIESGLYGKMWEDRLEKIRPENSNLIKRTISHLRKHSPKLGDDVCIYLFHKRIF